MVPKDLSYTGKAYWKLVKIDKCIDSIAMALNKGKIYTRSSCCGHSERDGEILLKDGRVLIIKEGK